MRWFLAAAPPLDQLNLRQTLRVLCTFFAIAAQGGLVRALANKMKLRDTLIAAVVSGSGGVVVGALCVYGWGPDRWYLTCAACGLAGWAGGNVVLDRLTIVAWTILRGYGGPRVPAPPSPATGQTAVDVGLPELAPHPRKEFRDAA